MFLTWPMQHLELELCQSFQPAALLADGLRSSLKPLQGGVIRSQYERATQEVLAVQLREMNNGEQLLPGNAVISLCR